MSPTIPLHAFFYSPVRSHPEDTLIVPTFIIIKIVTIKSLL